MSKPSVIILGSKPAAAVALETMLHRGWQVKAVVQSGQNSHEFIPGYRLGDLAAKYDIPIVKQDELPTDQVDYVISYMFRYRVKLPILNLARRAALNFHAGPLPEFGGWAFYNLAILENSDFYGCTCHHMDEGFDTGPLFKVNRFPIVAENETAWSLERKAQEEMVRLFIDFCEIAESESELPYIEQNKKKMRYMDHDSFEKLKEIPENSDEETIQRHARAFFYPPYECAYTKIGNVKVEVIPNIAKQLLAERLHYDDYERLLDVAKNYVAEKA